MFLQASSTLRALYVRSEDDEDVEEEADEARSGKQE